MGEAKSKASIGISSETKKLFDNLKAELGFSNADEAVRELIALGKRDAIREANPTRAADLDAIARLTAAINERATAMVASSALEAEEMVKAAEQKAEQLQGRVSELEVTVSKEKEAMKELFAEKQIAEAEAKRVAGLEEQVEALKAQIRTHNNLEEKMADYIELSGRVKELEGQLALAQKEVELLREFKK